MKELLKSIFNLTTILTCYISAIGYSIGYYFPHRLGANMFICLLSCYILGAIFDKVAHILLGSKLFKSKTKNKILFTIFIYAFYLAAWVIVDEFLDHDLDIDFLLTLGFVILFQVVSFVLKFFKEDTKRKIKKFKNKKD